MSQLSEHSTMLQREISLKHYLKDLAKANTEKLVADILLKMLSSGVLGNTVLPRKGVKGGLDTHVAITLHNV